MKRDLKDSRSTKKLYRPHYHFSPQANWMNDPNGLVYYEGEYHLFYQYHPASPFWGPMHWGHAVSTDLIHWRYLPIALYPDESGMIFSGSAVVDWNNTAGFGMEAMVIIFTYNKDQMETQNLAFSLDRGRTWTKYAGNPIIPNPPLLKDIRDPKVFWHEDHWVMCLASGDKILFYISTNLREWQPSGSFGEGYGSTGGVWETPDLFKLPIDGELETRWVLTVGVGNGTPAGGSGTQYFIGDFDGRTFTSENPMEAVLWADRGADYYAPQSWNDEPYGRRLMIGWMNNWSYASDIPTSGIRGMFSVIREQFLMRTGSGVRLAQKPVAELQNLRYAHQHWEKCVLTPDTNLLAGVRGTALEIIAEFQVDHTVDCFGFRVRVGAGKFTVIKYDVESTTLILDRTQSGRVKFNDGFARIHSAELSPMDSCIRLHIFVDSISVEVFANDGLVVFSECIFPTEKSQRLELFVGRGSLILNSLDIYQLDPARIELTA